MANKLVHDDLDVLVVGAGFAGLYQLKHLRRLGYKVKVVEEAGGLGGIWHWTKYPGARVDTEVPMYEYSDEELWKGWNYSELYPDRSEIVEYFKYVDQKWDLSKDIYFSTRVMSAEFDATINKWRVCAEGGKVFIAKFLDLCVGVAAKPYEAEFMGMEKFQGTIQHSHNWPQELELTGKRVAIIGTGASGVQIIQNIGPKAEHLTVFQRTPNLALPMRNRPLSNSEQSVDKATYPHQFKFRNDTFGGLTYTTLTKMACEDAPEERENWYERLWTLGGFRFWLAGYADTFYDENVNTEMYNFWRKKVRARINDPEMQNKLAPIKPPHAFGTKRPSLEMTYYEVFNQPNVNLVDLRANPIEHFTATGIRTKDGVNHACDIVVLATGFDMATGALHRIDIKGGNGTLLRDKWANGIRTCLGMTSAGFPNMFFLYSAHAPASFVIAPCLIEAQGDWVIGCINHTLKSGKVKIEASEQAEEKWTEKVHESFKSTLFRNTDGWYNGANIPGKKHEPLSYLGGFPMYLRECRAVEENGYAGFVTTKIEVKGSNAPIAARPIMGTSAR